MSVGRVVSGGSVREGDRVEVLGFGRKVLFVGELVSFQGIHCLVLPDGKAKPLPAPLENVRRVERAAPPPNALTREPTTEGKLHAVPRPKGPARDGAYLEWIRSMPCMSCRWRPSEAHHQPPDHPSGKAMGRKCSDYFTVPLCTEHHRYFHDNGHLPELDKRSTYQRFAEVEALLLERWLCRLREAIDAR